MKQSNLNHADGFFITPWTAHDVGVFVLAILGYLFIMYLSYKNDHIQNPEPRDWAGTLFFSGMFTIGFYQYAIHIQMPFGLFLPLFGIGILLSKPVSDWMFLSKDGKGFIISTFKVMLTSFLGRMGYTKKRK